MKLKNDLFLRALNGEPVERPPVWMMRQAGRYLPEFRALKEKYSFFERCQNPELAAEITLQPIERLSPDAAILFSDILVVPQALGMTVEMRSDVGPWLPNPIKTTDDAFEFKVPDVEETLGYVFEAIKLTKQGLADQIPLIGFAGSPWTLLCYMVQGQGSKNFDKAKAFCYTQPEAAHHVLQVLTDTTISYLEKKVEAGVNVVQIFDSWGGLLGPSDYNKYSWPYIKQISDALKRLVPVVVFAKGCWFALEEMSQSGVALGIDWTITPEWARRLTGGKVTLQGNMDPSYLLAPIPEIEKNTFEMIKRFGKDRYVANLGHGILPNVPVDHARAFIDTVKSFRE